MARGYADALAKKLIELGYSMVTGGTENHLVLWDLRPNGLTGSKMEYICDSVHITLNKNSVPGDTSALVPGGIQDIPPNLINDSKGSSPSTHVGFHEESHGYDPGSIYPSYGF